MHTMPREKELLQACAVLFGNNIALSRDFLHYLEVSGVKTAYRKRARETHPDLNSRTLGFPDTAGEFIRVQEAYEQLLGYLAHRGGHPGPPGVRAWPARHSTRPRPVHRPHNTDRSRSSAYGKPDPSTKARKPDVKRPSGKGGTDHARTATRNRGTGPGGHFKGPIPGRRLLLGHYLYYSGRAEWRTVIQAVGWQMGQRPRLGELASRFGWLRNSDVHRVHAKRKPLERFGDTAVRLGLLTTFQLKVLLAMQSRRQRKFGDFFVERGLFTREEMEALVKACSSHNESFVEPSRQAS